MLAHHLDESRRFLKELAAAADGLRAAVSAERQKELETWVGHCAAQCEEFAQATAVREVETCVSECDAGTREVLRALPEKLRGAVEKARASLSTDPPDSSLQDAFHESVSSLEKELFDLQAHACELE